MAGSMRHDARKRAERAAHSEEQYRAIFNAAADALVLRDADASVIDVNPASGMSGYTREEVLSAARVLTCPRWPLAKRVHRPP